MPPESRHSRNFSLPHPTIKVTYYDEHDTGNKESAESGTGSKSVSFTEETSKPQSAFDIGDISKLGLGFNAHNYDYGGMMKLIINNVLVTQNTLLSQLQPASSLLTESQLRVIILPNQIIGMATSDAKYHAVVLKESRTDPAKTEAKAKLPYIPVLHGHHCPTFGQALQSLLWKSVVGAAAYSVPGRTEAVEGEEDDEDEDHE